MSSAWLSAAIQEFEQVTLDSATELFRVRARARRGDDSEPSPVLETREHDAIADIYEPLAAGGDRRGLLRLAYAVPTERVRPSTGFSLRLPDGYRIELPEPTPGEGRAEAQDGQRRRSAKPPSERPDSREPDDVAARRIAELEQELRSTRQSVAQALSELDHAHTERDAARRDAESARAERDDALETAGEHQAEHARLTARLRQLQARIELLRADATGGRASADQRLRQLESVREQLATHVQALAELLSIDERSGDASGAADRLETIRARAVREANEHAERELRRLRAGTPL